MCLISKFGVENIIIVIQMTCIVLESLNKFHLMGDISFTEFVLHDNSIIIDALHLLINYIILNLCRYKLPFYLNNNTNQHVKDVFSCEENKDYSKSVSVSPRNLVKLIHREISVCYNFFLVAKLKL